MACRKIRKMMPAVLDRESGLTQKEWLQFQLHINRCRACKREYNKYQKLFALFNEIRTIPEPDHENLKEKIRKNIESIDVKESWLKKLRWGFQFNFRYVLQIGVFILVIGVSMASGILYRDRITGLYKKIFTHTRTPVTESGSVERNIVVPELPEVSIEKPEERGEEKPAVLEEPVKITKRDIKKSEPLPQVEEITKRDILTLKVLQAKKSGEQLKIYFNVLKNNKLIENISREKLKFQEYYPGRGWVENNGFELLPPGRKEPFYITLLLDYSDSMTPNLDLMESGVRKFIENLDENDRVMIIKFAEDVIITTDGFVRDRGLLRSAINKRFMLRYSTSLYKAIDVAINELKDKGDNKLLVVLTDGDDTHSCAFDPPVNFEDVFNKARTLRIPLITVGLGSEIVEEKLKTLAEGTGGMFIKVDKPEDLVAVYNELGRTIVQTPCMVIEYKGEKYSQIEKFKIVFGEKDLEAETTLIKKYR